MRSVRTTRKLVEPLECRRLLTLTPIGTDVIVPGPSEITNFDLAVAENGNYIVATVDDSAATNLTAVRYSADGKQLGGTLTLDTLPETLSNADVAVDMDADGDAVVLYRHAADELNVIRISRDGQVSAAQQIHQATGEESVVFSPAVSMDDSGRFFVGWIAGLETGHDDTVVLQSYNADGTARAKAITAAGPSDLSNYVNLDLDAYTDGSGAVFAFTVLSEGGAPSLLSGLVSKTAIIGEVANVALVNGPPSVSTYADGSFVIAYNKTNAGFDENLVAYSANVQRFQLSGKKNGSEIELGETLPGTGPEKLTRAVTVDATADGGFVAAYTRNVDDSSAVYVSRYDASNNLDPSGDVPITTVFARETAIGSGSNGQIVAGYLESPLNDQSPGILHLQQLTTQSTFIRNAELFVLGTAGADKVRVARDGGRIVVFRGDTFKTFDAKLIAALTVNGYGGNDSLINETDLSSTLAGGDGIDTLVGGSVADFIHGNNGSDSISGGDGNDKLFGDGGLDSLSGNAGRDSLFGGAGMDRLGGNGGRDKLFGGDGEDRLFGGASGDWLSGENEYDQVNGEGGDDRLYGDVQGNDTLHGNAGDDEFFTFNAKPDYLFGDGGGDSATADDDDVLTSIENWPASASYTFATIRPGASGRLTAPR